LGDFLNYWGFIVNGWDGNFSVSETPARSINTNSDWSFTTNEILVDNHEVSNVSRLTLLDISTQYIWMPQEIVDSIVEYNENQNGWNCKLFNQAYECNYTSNSSFPVIYLGHIAIPPEIYRSTYNETTFLL